MCDDSDQALSPTKVCTLFRCQVWVDGERIQPPLVKSEPHGFWLCEKCGVSYGVDAFKDSQKYPVGTVSTEVV